MACPSAGALPWGVVRFFHIEHVASVRAEVARLVEASRDGRIKLLYGFDTELWGDKQWLARAPAAAKLKSDLARAVPETRAARDVERSLLGQQDRWVLKPHAGAAGEGVVVGREQRSPIGAAAVERATRRPGWVAQRLVSPRPTLTAYVDARSGRVVRRKEIETLGIFLVEGRYAGAYVRSIPFATGIVVDSSSNFNVVATRERAPGVAIVSFARRRRRATARAPAHLALAFAGCLGPPPPSLRGARHRTPRRRRGCPQGGDAGACVRAAFVARECPRRASACLRSCARSARTFSPSVTTSASRTYAAHLDIPPADLSIAAGVLVRALAQDPVTWTSSRAGTFVEQEVLRWLANLVFPQAQHAGGVACTGGTQANLHAVLLARNLALPDAARLGIAAAMRKSGARSLKVLASSATHGSVGAAVRHAGIGDENLVSLPVDSADAVRLDALEAALDAAAREGDKIALVVLNAGTVGVGGDRPVAGSHRHRKSIRGARPRRRRARRDAPVLSAVRPAPRRDRARRQRRSRPAQDPRIEPGAWRSAPSRLRRRRSGREGSFAVLRVSAGHAVVRTLHARRHSSASGSGRVDPHAPPRARRVRAGRRSPLRADRPLRGGARARGRLRLHARPAMNLVAFRENGARGATRVFDDDARVRRHVSRYQSPRGEFLRAVFVNPATTGREIDGLLAILAGR